MLPIHQAQLTRAATYTRVLYSIPEHVVVL
jgi:hypothetical protein